MLVACYKILPLWEGVGGVVESNSRAKRITVWEVPLEG
jgi:hypothetical protein